MVAVSNGTSVFIRHICTGVMEDERKGSVSLDKKIDNEAQRVPVAPEEKQHQASDSCGDAIDGCNEGYITLLDCDDFKIATVPDGNGKAMRTRRDVSDSSPDRDGSHSPTPMVEADSHHQGPVCHIIKSASHRDKMLQKQGSPRMRRISHSLRRSFSVAEKEPEEIAWYVRRPDREEPEALDKSRRVMQMVFFDYNGPPEDEEN